MLKRKTGLAFLAVVGFFCTLSACDPAVTVHLVRKDREPMVCPGGAELSYVVHIQYKDGEQYVDRFEVDERVGYPTIGMLPGGIERQVAWVRFELYCGESEKPVLVTPKILLPDGLTKKDDWNYYYHVDWQPAPGGDR